jgi:hypothetical protein
VSERAGARGGRLERQTKAVVEEVREWLVTAGDKVSCTLGDSFQGVEKGKLSVRRPALLAAVRYALDKGPRGAIIVARDEPRFIRSETYHHHTNHEARPTSAELDRLHELTGGVVLATLEDLDLTEKERQSRAVGRSGKNGRPSTVSDDLAIEILDGLGDKSLVDGRWEHSLTVVARQLINRHPELSGKNEAAVRSLIQRLLDSPVPEWFLKVRRLEPGLRWKSFVWPGEVYRNYLRLK